MKAVWGPGLCSWVGGACRDRWRVQTVPRCCSCRGAARRPPRPRSRVCILWLHACWGKGPLPNGSGFWSCLACRWAGQGLSLRAEAMMWPWAGAQGPCSRVLPHCALELRPAVRSRPWQCGARRRSHWTECRLGRRADCKWISLFCLT